MTLIGAVLAEWLEIQTCNPKVVDLILAEVPLRNTPNPKSLPGTKAK